MKDLQYLRKLMVEYPTVDMLEEVKKFAAHKLDKPAKQGTLKEQYCNYGMGKTHLTVAMAKELLE